MIYNHQRHLSLCLSEHWRLNGRETSSLLAKPLPFNPPRLLCLGRLALEKGFDLALLACTSVAACFPRARLIMAVMGQRDPTGKNGPPGVASHMASILLARSPLTKYQS
jgi:hypothetical protein